MERASRRPVARVGCPQATTREVVVMMRCVCAVASVILLLSPSLFGQVPGQPPPGEVGPAVGVAPTNSINETFEQQPLQGWELGPGIQVQQVGQGHALVFGQPGTASILTGARDLTLTFKYRPGGGIMEAIFCAGGEPPNQRGYHLMLMPGEVGVVREFGEGNMSELSFAPFQRQTGAWNEVSLQVNSGQLTLSVDSQQILSATDPQPLPAGGVGFMSHQGGDAIDDVVLTSGASGATPTPTQPVDQQPQQPGMQPVEPPAQTLPTEPVAQQPAEVPTQQAGAFSETFAQQPQQGWEIGGAAVQNGALTFNNPGEAWWIAVQQRDLTLRCRYRPGQGLMHMVLCASGEPPANQDYRLLSEENQLLLTRASGQQETQLAAAEYRWQPGQWHDLAVQIMAGQVSVHVNNQPVLSATDPQPPPAGTIGFIFPHGGGGAIDDLHISVPQPGGLTQPQSQPTITPQEPGPPATPQPPQPTVLQQPTQPPVTQQPPGPGPQTADTGILLQGLIPRLQPAGVTSAEQLVARASNPGALNQLSAQTNVPVEEILGGAALSELGRVLGPQTVAQNRGVLQLLDIDRPEDLARFQGQADALQRMAAQASTAVGAQPPDLTTVQSWLSAASQGNSRIPAGPQLLQHQLPSPSPPRAISVTAPPMVTVAPVAGGSQQMLQVQPQLPEAIAPIPMTPHGGLPQTQMQGGTPMQQFSVPQGDQFGGLQAPQMGAVTELSLHRLTVSIPAGQSACSGQFLADRAGLYRLQCRFSRPGGMATLRWFIDRPQETLQMSGPGVGVEPMLQHPVAVGGQPPVMSATPRTVGWQPLIQGAQELSADPTNTETDQYIYFWLRASDVPMTGKLQLRLTVSQNLKFVGTADQIEGTGTGTVPDQGPITGVVFATWVQPVVVEAGKSARLGVNEFPLSVVETSVQSNPAGQPGGGVWQLTAWLDRVPPAPLTQDQFGNVVYSPAESTNLWQNLEVLRNDVPVPSQPMASPPPGTPPRAMHTCVQAPKAGVYSVLVSPEGVVSMAELTSSGKVYSYARAFDQASNQWQQQPRYGGAQEVQVGFLSQGGSRMSVVAELVGLEVRDQFEGDGNPGEFHVECTTSEIRTPNIAGDLTGAIDEVYSNAQVRATTRGWPAAAYRGETRIPTNAQGRTITYPRYLMAEWTEGSEQYNAGSASLAVWEHDPPPGDLWQQITFLGASIKRLAKIFIAAYSGDFGKATEGMVEHVKALTKYTNPTDRDDIVGYPALGWDETCVFPSGDFKMLTMRSSPNPAYTTVMQAGQTGWATDVAPGGDEATVTGHVMMRRVPAYWASYDAALLSFTLSQDLDPGGDPTDVIVLKSSSDWTSDRGWDERNYPTAVAGGYTSAKVYPARANQRVAVDPDSPPPSLAQRIQQYGFGRSAAFYIEWHLWDQDPNGDDTYIGTFSRTFYYQDFIKNAGQQGQWQLLDGGQTRVNYYREGDNYVGHFILDAPGGYLGQIELKVYARIFEG